MPIAQRVLIDRAEEKPAPAAPYAHGPALARNPSLADLLLAWATGSVPAPLEDVEERALRAQRLEAVGARGWRHATTGSSDAVRRMRDLVKLRRS